jgi:hypothetical protein
VPSDRVSPSSGWRDVAREFCADGGVDHETGNDSPHSPSLDPCPDCGGVPGVDSDDLCCEVYLARVETGT